MALLHSEAIDGNSNVDYTLSTELTFLSWCEFSEALNHILQSIHKNFEFLAMQTFSLKPFADVIIQLTLIKQ